MQATQLLWCRQKDDLQQSFDLIQSNSDRINAQRVAATGELPHSGCTQASLSSCTQIALHVCKEHDMALFSIQQLDRGFAVRSTASQATQ